MTRKQVYHIFMDHDEKYDREWLEQTVQRIEEEFKQERERNSHKMKFLALYPNFLERRLKRNVIYPPPSPEEKERLRQEIEELLKRSEELEAKRPIHRLKRALHRLKDTLFGYTKDYELPQSIVQTINQTTDKLTERLKELINKYQMK